MGTETDALTAAHDAKNLATKAVTMVEGMQPQIAEISRSIADMRKENADQHRENAAAFTDNLKIVHTRISSVKTAIDENRKTAAAEIKALDEKLTAKVNKQANLWQKHKDKILITLALVGIAMIADKFGVKIPGL